MAIKRKMGLALLLMAAFLVAPDAVAGDVLADIFEYHFPHVDPIKIYSGTVRFTHTNHIVAYRIACVRCHHKLEPDDVRVGTPCKECHTKEGFPRFEAAADLSAEKRQQHFLVALHDQCIDCHIEVRQNHHASRVPISCTRCHLRN
jgi:hypothetical protein